MPFVGLQLSLAVTPLNTFGTAAWQPASALALVGAGQLTLGTVVSFTVNVVVQLALLPASSVAVTVIVCAPRPTCVTAAWQPASVLALVGAGQLTLGTVVSFTVNVVVQLALLPASSVAVTVMVCAPRPTCVPAAGD